MTEQENFERIENLNTELAKSDLPYHTAETEQIQKDRTAELEQPAEEPKEDSPAE